VLEIEFEAKRLYYGLLLAYETLRITKYLLDQAEAHYENVKAKFEQGTSSKFDVLQSKVQVSLLVPQYVNAQKSIEMISADIKKLLYINIQDKFEATERLSYETIDVRELAFLNEAYSNNPQMKLRILGVDLKKWAIEEAKSGWYPNINATTDYMYRSDNLSNMFNTRHNNINFGVSGTVSIFDGMSTLAKVNEARARYAQEILGKENIIEQIARDIKQGCLDLKEAHAIILAQKDNLEEAKEALRISYISYDNGVGINLDVIDSQTALGQVEKNLVSGIYDYLVAQSYLDRTMGREYFESISKEAAKP
jgi:outer membrane protein TolC